MVSPVITVTDTSLTGGAPGIMAYGTARADNWAGGNIGGGASYTIGGTVSGLSGTVVLQDNGGDNLSVTANGSFTFPTQLASGAAYAVTVKPSRPGRPARSQRHRHHRLRQRHQRRRDLHDQPARTYSVGGTVSGLTGTVVLQDNGGDNLSVTANGSFTFPTAARQRRGVRGNGQDPAVRADLHGQQRHRHHRRRPTSPTSP